MGRKGCRHRPRPDHINLSHFSKWLLAKANTLSFVVRPQPKHTPALATVTALVAAALPRKPSSKQQYARPLTCVYCDRPGHNLDECKRYMLRWLIGRSNSTSRGAATGASPEDRQAECDSGRKCTHCQRTGRHHHSLCPMKFGRPGTGTTQKPSVTHHAKAAASPWTFTERPTRTEPHRWTGSGPYANCHRCRGEPTASRLEGDSTYPVRQRQLPHLQYADLGRQTPASSEQAGHATPVNVWEGCHPARLCTQC